jgi:hypothetical protein
MLWEPQPHCPDAVDEEDETDGRGGQYEPVEAGPGAAAQGLALAEILLVPEVLNGGHGELSPCASRMPRTTGSGTIQYMSWMNGGSQVAGGHDLGTPNDGSDSAVVAACLGKP